MLMLQWLPFGVKPGNAVNYGIILAVVLPVSVLAASFPVRRATGIDPLIALRFTRIKRVSRADLIVVGARQLILRGDHFRDCYGSDPCEFVSIRGQNCFRKTAA
jgi:hypothetical protein